MLKHSKAIYEIEAEGSGENLKKMNDMNKGVYRWSGCDRICQNIVWKPERLVDIVIWTEL